MCKNEGYEENEIKKKIENHNQNKPERLKIKKKRRNKKYG